MKTFSLITLASAFALGCVAQQDLGSGREDAGTDANAQTLDATTQTPCAAVYETVLRACGSDAGVNQVWGGLNAGEIALGSQTRCEQPLSRLAGRCGAEYQAFVACGLSAIDRTGNIICRNDVNACAEELRTLQACSSSFAPGLLQGGTLLTGGACGDEGQPCCSQLPERCLTGQCTAGVCAHVCGLAGLRCCVVPAEAAAACGSGTSCTSGVCQVNTDHGQLGRPCRVQTATQTMCDGDPQAIRCCNSVCVDTTSDVNHCNSCTRMCPANSTCQTSTCVAR